MTVLRLATRGSALALTQTKMVAEALCRSRPNLTVELLVVRTAGDERAGRSTPSAGADKSRFVKEIEDALVRGDASLAVHSAKDVPGEVAEGLAIAAVPPRADPRDAICGVSQLDNLPEGAVVGTASARRRAQLRAARPDLRIVELFGNVDTRLRRLEQGRYDAIVLAAAGLARLGLATGSPLSTEVVVPAPGQGCLALQARADDWRVRTLVKPLDDPCSHEQLLAERAVARGLNAGCETPLGVYARPCGRAQLELLAFAGLDGAPGVRGVLRGSARDPEALGAEMAELLLARGFPKAREAA